MLSTVRGRVEADPMWVPAPSAPTPAPGDAFEDVLQQRLEHDRPAPGEVAREAEQAPAEAEVPAADEAAELPTDEAPATTDPADDDLGGAPAAYLGAATVEPQDQTQRRVEPVRQETAGKGADSPRRSPSSAGEQVLATLYLQNANTPTAPSAGAPSAAIGAVGGTTAAKAAGGSTFARGFGTDATAPQLAPRAGAVTTGYRTSAAASAQRLDQARDSVFKQILFKLDGDGGQMRLRLEPPNLGELDLLMTVENGNQLHLTIRAERSDLAEMLQRNLGELKQTLQDAGLDVTGAQIEARSDGARRDLRDTDFGGGSTAAHDDVPDHSAPRFGGFVSAEGLDYWA